MKQPQNLKSKTRITHLSDQKRQPIVEHLYELRKRLIHIAASVMLFSTLAYFVQQSLVRLLLKPAGGQHFIYTSPTGGIVFLFDLCMSVGVILSIPVIIYQTLRFLEPVFDHKIHGFIVRSVGISLILGAIGVLFGYIYGLPLALHFLNHQFTTKQIQPLFTLSEYVSFVIMYLVGSALIFQIALVIAIINKVKPLTPRKLFGAERWVILVAFIISMLMAPTVNLIDQLVIALPIILSYQVGIGVVWWTNRNLGLRYPKHVQSLVNEDKKVQQERITKAQNNQQLIFPAYKSRPIQVIHRPPYRQQPINFDFVRRT